MDVTPRLEPLIPISEASRRYSITKKELLRMVEEGLVQGARLEGGEILVSSLDARKAAGLSGILEVVLDPPRSEGISINQASRLTGVSSATIWKWYKHGWVQVVGRGPRRAIYLNKAQILALSGFHKSVGRRGKRLIPRAILA